MAAWSVLLMDNLLSTTRAYFGRQGERRTTNSKHISFPRELEGIRHAEKARDEQLSVLRLSPLWAMILFFLEAWLWHSFEVFRKRGLEAIF